MKIEKIAAQPPKVDAARDVQATRKAQTPPKAEAAVPKAEQGPRNPPHLGNKVDTTA